MTPTMAGHFPPLSQVVHLVVYSARGEAAGRQPGGQLGGVVAAQHAVACLKVAGEKVRVPQVVLEPG